MARGSGEQGSRGCTQGLRGQNTGTQRPTGQTVVRPRRCLQAEEDQRCFRYGAARGEENRTWRVDGRQAGASLQWAGCPHTPLGFSAHGCCVFTTEKNEFLCLLIPTIKVKGERGSRGKERAPHAHVVPVAAPTPKPHGSGWTTVPSWQPVAKQGAPAVHPQHPPRQAECPGLRGHHHGCLEQEHGDSENSPAQP